MIKQLVRAALRRVPPRTSEQIVALLEQNIGIGTGFDPSQSGEIAPINFVASLTDRPLMLFDVGANTGQYAQLVKETLGKRELEIHSFEPSAETVQRFRERHAGDDRIRINQCAVAEQDGIATLYMDSVGSELASLSRRDLQHHGIDHATMQEQVCTRSLSDYCLEHHIEHIDLLKIDVEGWELRVLRGAAPLFQASQVRLVQFEFGGANIDTRTFFRDFFDFFRSHEMELYRIVRGNRLLRLVRYVESLEKFRCANLLAAGREIRNQIEATFDVADSLNQ